MEPWRRNQIAVTAATFVGFTGFTLVMPFLALYLQALGLTATGEIALWTGATLGITPAIAALCAPLWGRVGDRFGDKLQVQRALVSGIVVMVLMSIATRPWHLLALRAAQGFVAGYGPLTLSMAARSAPPDRMSKAIALVQSAQRVAPAIGPVLGGVLASAFGLRRAFVVSALVYALAFAIVTWLYVEPRRAEWRARRDDGERVTFSNILALENFVLLAMVIFGLQLVERAFGPVLLLHLAEIGYGARAAAVLVGTLFSTLALAAACGNQLATIALARSTARAAIVRAVLVAAGALAVFAFGREAWVLMVAIAVFGAAGGSAMTMAFAAAGSVIPPGAHGASFGVLSGASLIGSAVSPLLSGLVAGHSIRIVFFSGVVMLLVIAVVVRGGMVAPGARIQPAPPVDEE